MQAYNRAQATIGLFQDIATVTETLWDGLDEEDAEVIGQILYDYAKSKLISTGIRIVSGTGGKAIGYLGRQLQRSKITKNGIQATRNWFRANKAKYAGGSFTTPSSSLKKSSIRKSCEKRKNATFRNGPRIDLFGLSRLF